MLLAAGACPAGAAELKLLTPGAPLSSLKVLLPEFQKQTGHTVAVTLSPALAVAKRLEREEFDIAILGQGSARELEKQQRLAGVTIIARSGVGAFVRRGDPKPDIGTVEAFVRALRAARVITYSDPALGGSASNYVANLLAKLDTTGEIKARTRLATEYRSIANIVAAGGVDIALNQITEILADPRLELIGPLPPPVQRYTSYAAGIVVSSANRPAAASLIAFLQTPAAVRVFRSKGFEPQQD
ncbi:MAG: substrate-binding domain-containing protein [Hyphomicrobiales bacterium]|nr:substrate-binding domain-containing protein [Hyphomicrobiales bacterium]